MNQPARQLEIGTCGNTVIHIVQWDGVTAQAELSCACLFTHSLHSDGLHGGAADLNQALGGALTQLWSAGLPAKDGMQPMLLTKLPKSMAASMALVIGMGPPEKWTPHVSSTAVAIAAGSAIQHRVQSAAFAPSLIDHGIPNQGDIEAHFLGALLIQLTAANQLVALGLADPLPLKHWYFDAGAAHFDTAAKNYQAAFAAWQSQASSLKG